MLNTYGLKMSGPYSPEYLQLNYDRSTGEVWTDFFSSIGHNSWTVYHDKNVLHCGNLYSPHTMQEIADIIHTAVQVDDIPRNYNL